MAFLCNAAWIAYVVYIAVIISVIAIPTYCIPIIYTLVGGPSGSPVILINPDAAYTMKSNPDL